MTKDEAFKKIGEVWFNKESEFHKAYWNSGHLLHAEAVEQMSDLTKIVYGDTPIAPEIMPIVKPSSEYAPGWTPAGGENNGQ